MKELYNFTYNNYSSTEFEKFCTFEPVQIVPQDNIENPIDVPTPIRMPLRDVWILKKPKVFGEDLYKENYGDVFFSVFHKRMKVIVCKDDKKVSIKVFTYIRHRDRGKKYFRVKTAVHFLTYNYITHDLYHGNIINYHKKRKFSKTIKRNDFAYDPYNKMMYLITNTYNNFVDFTALSNDEKTNIIYSVSKIFTENIPGQDRYVGYSPINVLYKTRADSLGFKLPNNWHVFVKVIPSPTLKILRKNDMKLIDSIMEMKYIYGDKMRKILHTITNFGNMNMFSWAMKFFGKDYILGKPDYFLKSLIEHENFTSTLALGRSDSFTKKEKQNIFEIFKLVIDKHIDVSTFSDHFQMYSKIKLYEDVKWKSTTYEEFSDEHLQYTERVDFYTKGIYFRYYNEDFLKLFDKPIMNNYYPVLLTSSEEYNMESFVQSNCVKTYINKPQIFIVSLRKGGKESKERATIEFSINEINGKVVCFRQQTLGRFNQKLSDEWETPVSILEQKIKSYINEDTCKIYTCLYQVGYNEFKSGLKFVNDYFNFDSSEKVRTLGWENENMKNRDCDMLMAQIIPLHNNELPLVEF